MRSWSLASGCPRPRPGEGRAVAFEGAVQYLCPIGGAEPTLGVVVDSGRAAQDEPLTQRVPPLIAQAPPRQKRIASPAAREPIVVTTRPPHSPRRSRSRLPTSCRSRHRSRWR